MKAVEVMSSPVIALRPADPVAHAKNLMLRHKVDRLVVMDRGEAVGMLSMNDLAEGLGGESPNWRRRPIDQIPVSRVMHKGVLSVSPNTDVGKIAGRMIKEHFSSLVISDGGKIEGIVTKTDLVRHFSEELKGKFKVRELMTPQPVTVKRNHSVARVKELMQKHKICRLIVEEGKAPIGMITESDIGLFQLEVPGRGLPYRKVKFTRRLERGGRPRARYVKYVALLTAGDVMKPDPLTVGTEDDVAKAARVMLDRGISGLPVVRDGGLVGIITKTDIVRGISRVVE